MQCLAMIDRYVSDCVARVLDVLRPGENCYVNNQKVNSSQQTNLSTSWVDSRYRFSFASGAEEKVVRVFDAPKNFLDNFSQLCGVNIEQTVSFSMVVEILTVCVDLKEKLLNSTKWSNFSPLQTKSAAPEGASVPALGLSNKAVFQGEKQADEVLVTRKDDQYTEAYFSALSLTGRWPLHSGSAFLKPVWNPVPFALVKWENSAVKNARVYN